MLERLYGWFRNLPIRYKLLVTYSAVLTAFVTLGGAVSYSLVRETLEQNIESELTNSTAAILNLVKTSAAASIRNHLRAVADRNLEIVENFYERYRRGELSEAEAKARAEEVILCQRIGRTGYVCCLDSAGVVVIHPKRELLATNLSAYGFIQELKARRKGYLEYDWQNPGDAVQRPKAMYMSYFEPWDWVIVVSSYRDEFAELVNVEDFRESVLSLRFGQTGYAYVADRSGNVVIHPKFQGSNIFQQRAVPSEFFDEMLHQKSGKVLYSWRNPGEGEARQKLVIYNHIPEYGWIVASSSYLDEIFAPLRRVRRLFVFTVLGALLLVLPITLRRG
ncbi:MAG: cache domain-containing protein, partial [Proteobacteria bacterium]|nr:cache domain-containing protein [Pseudomonadota bacterium]